MVSCEYEVESIVKECDVHTKSTSLVAVGALVGS